MADLIDRQEAIRAFDDAGFCSHGYIVDVLEELPPAQPTYTDEEIQKMADLEQAEIEKAYQLGYEEGKKDAQPELIKVSVDREMTEEELKELKKKIADSPLVLLPSAQFATDINVGDTISRQEAIDAVSEGCLELRGIFEGCKEKLLALPSAQPEIIRCKDCKNSEHWYRDKRRCFLWAEDGIGVFDDGFCSYAERKENG